MYIKIHRGTTQIGGNLIEIGTAQTRILFDAGANLPPLDEKGSKDSIEIEGLTCGKPAFDWVFLSHHHNDHCGLVDRILPGIPILSGEETHRILDVISDFTDSPRPEIYLHFKSGQPIQLDDIRVTPIGVDHSAVDAHMFLIQAEGKSVLYTGDYRVTAQIPAQIRQLLGGQKLDVLISEGTNIRVEKQSSNTPQNEKQVEQRAFELMKQHGGTVFVLCSSTNEERIRAMHRAAKAAGRAVCEDLFLTAVRTQREENTLRFVAHYTSEKETPRTYAYFQRCFERRELLSAGSLAKLPGEKVIFVRTSMLPCLKNYLACRPDEKNLLIYSIWQGYRETRPVNDLLDFCDSYGIDVADLHCSGHAYRNAIQELIGVLNPQALIPIHCEAQDREQFKALHPNCLMVRDGERWEV
ncbi:MBL fold metallo-hydrolase [Caproiciproducens galactitolivorans]|uniref:MBL fold metallo-hydrolase n=1 Tax=Caproiciproducens galactitolivorans TaxID=642589 RepID=A0ABT4BVF0_9FIRM|nr:MBL fold metallo-hydrolase [Caproiciproducens galactitolivorans]MCY1714867.1 MBL fold metallo-hydrolase [Caproiciproducens galactitolivorans]